jgi:hypothetical protein
MIMTICKYVEAKGIEKMTGPFQQPTKKLTCGEQCEKCLRLYVCNFFAYHVLEVETKPDIELPSCRAL